MLVFVKGQYNTEQRDRSMEKEAIGCRVGFRGVYIEGSKDSEYVERTGLPGRPTRPEMNCYQNLSKSEQSVSQLCREQFCILVDERR